MAAPALDFRPAGFRFRWGAAGAAAVRLRAPVGTLAGRELRMWVQPKAHPLPALDQATATATISEVSTEEVDEVEFDIAVATFPDVSLLTQGTWYRVLLADGDQVWANGLVRTSNDGTDEQATTLDITVSSGTIELQLTVAPAGPGGGAALPAGTAGQMFRVGTDGETVEAVSPNTAGAWLRLNGTGHVPDVHLAADIVRESEMTTAIGAAIDDLVGGAPGALDTLNELAAALGDDESFAATVTAALATKVTAAEVAAAIAAARSTTVVPYVVTGNVTVSTLEAALTLSPSGLRFLLGYPTLLVHAGDGAPLNVFPGGTVTGGDKGLWVWDGSALTFERDIEAADQLSTWLVMNGSGALVGALGPHSQPALLDLGAGEELVVASIAAGAAAVSYDNGTSGLSAADVQAALDELAGSVAGWSVPPNATHFLSGSYYGPPGVATGGTRTIPSGHATATPWPVKLDVTISSLQIDLSGASAAGLVFDVHLFATDPTTGYPTGSPVATATMTTTGTGTQVLNNTTGTVELPADLYFGIVHNRSAGTITPRCVAANTNMEPIPHSNSTSANQLSCWLHTGAGTSAITSWAAIGSVTGQNQGPVVQIGVA